MSRMPLFNFFRIYAFFFLFFISVVFSKACINIVSKSNRYDISTVKSLGIKKYKKYI